MYLQLVQVMDQFFQSYYDIKEQQGYQLINYIDVFRQHMNVVQNQMVHKHVLMMIQHHLQANV